MKFTFATRYTHGRLRGREYEKGETPARYGVARQLEDGTYEFLSDYGRWGNRACVWTDPPEHYIKDRYAEGAFIVNFRKKNAPQPEYFIR